MEILKIGNKYRIKKVNDSCYLPQWKGWFFWKNFASVWHYADRTMSHTISCMTMEDAKHFLEKFVINVPEQCKHCQHCSYGIGKMLQCAKHFPDECNSWK